MIALALCLLGLAGAPAPAQAGAPAQEPAEPAVGMPGLLSDVILPGGELEVAPGTSLLPLVVRLTAARPHGDRWRYDIVYWGREAGDYDLRDYLQRVDGGATLEGPDALPPIPVRIRSVLPPERILPNAPQEGRLPGFGGYRTLLIAAGVLWVGGLLAILLVGRRHAQARAQAARPRSLAEVLRPLVERALAGTLAPEERSRLELGLVALWRRRLGLEALRPEEVLARLREHAQAGPLLTSLEQWLHRPGSGREVDLNALLAPYRDLPPEAFERVVSER